MKTWRYFTEQSRHTWGREVETTQSPNVDELCLGALQRIADATETIARILDCENFKRMPRDLRAIRRNTTKRAKRLTHRR